MAPLLLKICRTRGALLDGMPTYLRLGCMHILLPLATFNVELNTAVFPNHITILENEKDGRNKSLIRQDLDEQTERGYQHAQQL